MAILLQQLTAALSPGMWVPEELARLYAWIERNCLDRVGADGKHIGVLYPLDRLRAEWSESEIGGGTYIEFGLQDNKHLHQWLANDDPSVIERLCVFARTGADGSVAAFWLDDEGHQRIVHLGSGSGSTLVCVLASEMMDFLRLLAIGYDEICWGERYRFSPNEQRDEGQPFVYPNWTYRAWLVSEFSVSIPARASEIVEHPSFLEDEVSEDLFWRWVEEVHG